MEVTKEKGDDTAVSNSTLLWTLPSIMLFLEKQLSCADVAVVHQSAASLLQVGNRCSTVHPHRLSDGWMACSFA